MPFASVNRRTWLRTTAAAGAALGLGTTLARAGNSAADAVVVAIMGTNGRGAGLAAGFAGQSQARIAYICDVDQQALGKGMKAAEGAARAAPEAIGDFRRALDDPAVDALVIAAPDHWHAPATIMACQAGKHVYVEKPASHNGHEGELMVAAARKHRRVVQLGTQRRSSPGLREAIGRIHAGEIGRTLFARGWITSTRPSIGHGRPAEVPTHLDYSLWQGPAPDRPYRDNIIHYHWHWFWNWGTGELGNNGIHALDVCRWGLNVDYPRRVVCGGGKFHFDDDQETPDTQLATFDFGDKAIHWEHRTWSPRGLEGSDFGIVFYGESGSMVLTANQYQMFDAGGAQVAAAPAPYNDAEHIVNFLECVRSGGEPNAPIEEGVKSTALCHLGNIAYRTGRTVNLEAGTCRIVGDDDAAAIWKREYRPGWEPVV